MAQRSPDRSATACIATDFYPQRRKSLKRNLRKATVAASAFALAALGWPEQDGLSFLVIGREGRSAGRPPAATRERCGRRQYRRAVVGTTAAVGAGAAYYRGAGDYSGSPYYSSNVRGARAAYYGGSAAPIPDGGTPQYAVRATTRAAPSTATAGGTTTPRARLSNVRPAA